MVEESQGQGGLDGEIRVPSLPTPPATPAGRPGSDCFRGQPHRHIAASNEGLVIGRPVRYAILRLAPGMNLRLHPRSVAPAEGREKCGPRRPTRNGYSCNNARRGRGVESDQVAAARGGLDAVIAGLLFMGGMRRSEVSAYCTPRRASHATSLRAFPVELHTLFGMRRRSRRAAGRQSTAGGGSVPCDRCRGTCSGSTS